MNILEIYRCYCVPVNLQQHMMRVAAVAGLIIDSWIGVEVSRQHVIEACLVHDLAKVVTFDMSQQKKYISDPNELSRLKLWRLKCEDIYGNDERVALLKMLKQIGIGKNVIQVVRQMEWQYLSWLLSKKDIAVSIAIYADMRISPSGLVSLSARIKELEKRRNQQFVKEEERMFVDLENVIQQHTINNVKLLSSQQVRRQILSEIHNFNISV